MVKDLQMLFQMNTEVQFTCTRGLFHEVTNIQKPQPFDTEVESHVSASREPLSQVFMAEPESHTLSQRI